MCENWLNMAVVVTVTPACCPVLPVPELLLPKSEDCAPRLTAAVALFIEAEDPFEHEVLF